MKGLGVIYFTLSILILFLVESSVQMSKHHFCGAELADQLSLVCGARGYNKAFEPEEERPRGRGRYKRGIVDECCKRGCSWTVLESYCSPELSDSSENEQVKLIQKRSEPSDQGEVDGLIGDLQMSQEGNSLESSSASVELSSQSTDQPSYTIIFQKKDSSSSSHRPTKTPLTEPLNALHSVKSEAEDIKIHSTKEAVGLYSSPQIGRFAPYFSRRSLVVPSSRKALTTDFN